MGEIMKYGIVIKPIATIYEYASLTMESDGKTLSAISDQLLYGMLVAVVEEVKEYFFVKTFYGYSGYLPKEDLLLVDKSEAYEWEASSLHVVSGICVDVLSLPKVQGVCYANLFRGAIVKVEEWDFEETGWVKVSLADGTKGFMRNQFLWEKKFSQAGVFTGTPVQGTIADEAQFRRSVTETAKLYLGVQYRWGGRCTAGIDCSGLTSQSYLLNGILTWRDAKIVEGFPVHEISGEDAKPGDLLYFPGHIAMYLGNGDFIHSTGKVGSGGVVINSLNPESPVYREDLVKSLYAVGSIFG